MLAAEGMAGPAPIFEGVFGFEKLVSGPLKIGGAVRRSRPKNGPVISHDRQNQH